MKGHREIGSEVKYGQEKAQQEATDLIIFFYRGQFGRIGLSKVKREAVSESDLLQFRQRNAGGPVKAIAHVAGLIQYTVYHLHPKGNRSAITRQQDLTIPASGA